LKEGDWETGDLKPRPCVAPQEVEFTEKSARRAGELSALEKVRKKRWLVDALLVSLP
jgi:hypothetical protein